MDCAASWSAVVIIIKASLSFCYFFLHSNRQHHLDCHNQAFITLYTTYTQDIFVKRLPFFACKCSIIIIIINSTRRSVFLVWFSVYRVFFLFLHLRSLRCCSTQKHIDRIATHTWKKRERISKRLFSGYVAKTLWLAKKPSAHRRKKIFYSTNSACICYFMLLSVCKDKLECNGLNSTVKMKQWYQKKYFIVKMKIHHFNML